MGAKTVQQGSVFCKQNGYYDVAAVEWEATHHPVPFFLSFSSYFFYIHKQANTALSKAILNRKQQ
jgi:hypothetical protein